MFPPDLLARADALVEACVARRLVLATAESCTGGLVSALITDVAGSSAVLERGFVTYSNTAKQEMLGVDADLLAREGAVSRSVALAMASGALDRSRADIAVSVTGIAGPGGGSAAKPVGLVHFGCAGPRGRSVHVERRFPADGRGAIRLASVEQALTLLEQAVSALPGPQ